MESLLDENSANKSKSRKEFQAQITALKKQAKSNKKNKKDLLSEIIKLEKEFSEASFEEKISDLPGGDSVSVDEESDHTQPRISKAQKRRQKKILNERERAHRIEEQEEINKQGARHNENLAIKNLLKKRALCIFDVPSNGDCLYNAVEHQLSINNADHLSVSELRKRTAAHLRENKDHFLPFMSHSNSGDLLTDMEFEDYCQKVESTHAWGGQIELKAISSVLQRTIEVLQAEGPPTIQGDEFKTKPLTLTYHRHVFGLGEHYNSTQPLLAPTDSEISD